MLKTILFGLILPNSAFIAASQWLEISRPLINWDYAFSALLIALGWRKIGILISLAFLLIDTLTLASQILPFTRLNEIAYLLKFATTASSFHSTLLITTVILIFLKSLSLAYSGEKITRAQALILFNTITLATVISNLLPSSEESKFYQQKKTLISSQTVNFLSSRQSVFLSFFTESGQALTPLPRAGSASNAWKGQLKNRLLLIVVESWGAVKDPALQKTLIAPLASHTYNIAQHGEINFTGVTLGGELRELCHLHPNHFNLSEQLIGFEDCLPNRLKKLGYATKGMHGAVSLMYDRRKWYPRAGIDDPIFFESKAWPRRCYSFPGACDIDMLGELETFFSLSGKRFFYWLTLNSHSRYDPRDIKLDKFNCQKYLIPTDSESCRNLKLQAQFFYSLSKSLEKLSMRDIDIIIVGDHTPVIMNLSEKHQVFKDGTVPWLRLTPRVTEKRQKKQNMLEASATKTKRATHP